VLQNYFFNSLHGSPTCCTLRERYKDLDTGAFFTFDTNYAKDANIVRGMGVITACLGTSLLVAKPLPVLGCFALGKALAACITMGIGCGMVYYRTRMQSKWIIHPPIHSYKASFSYGIKNYFLKPLLWTLSLTSKAYIIHYRYRTNMAVSLQSL
jgi:hypothetical protein